MKLNMKKAAIKIAKRLFYLSYYFKLEKIAERLRFRNSSKSPWIFIEITNRCNLNCIMCPRNHLKREVVDMDFEIFKKIIDEASEIGVEHIRFGVWGEPFLSPDIFNMIKYAKENGIKDVGFSSNGTLLNKERAEKLARSGIDLVKFSIDGINLKTYRNIRNADLNEVIKNIIYLVELRKRLNKKFIISISSLFMNYTHNEIAELMTFWKDKVDEINIQKCIKFDYPEFDGLAQREYTARKHACIQPFDRLVIFANGMVGVCCDDLNAEIIVGDIRKDTLKEILNGEKINKIRRIHLNHEFEELPICNKCEMIRYEIEDLIL